jgi:hypothetical protein
MAVARAWALGMGIAVCAGFTPLPGPSAWGVDYGGTLPDAAERARDLPPLLARLNDPAAEFEPRSFNTLVRSLAEDGDRPVLGDDDTIIVPSCVVEGVVDAIAPDGRSRRQQALALARAAWPRKSGWAWVELWSLLRAHGEPPGPAAVAALPGNLALVDPERRRNLLMWGTDAWTGWGSPALTALLLEWLKEPVPPNLGDNARYGLMEHLYATDPAAGRARIVQAITDDEDALPDRALLLLPDAPIPAFDALFRGRLAGNPSYRTIVVMERYGTPAILPAVEAWHARREPMGWPVECALLRFLVRYDRAYGPAAVRYAMDHRRPNDNHYLLLNEVLGHFPGDDVEALLAEYLHDPEEVVGVSAVNAMAMHPGWRARMQRLVDGDGALPAGVRTQAGEFLAGRLSANPVP